MDTDIIMMGEPPAPGGDDAPRLGLLRLLQLVSPSLPVGAFTYSQGIEWAVESGWIGSVEGLDAWLRDQLSGSLSRVDLPILARLMSAAAVGDDQALALWSERLIASRETAELRAEESQRGRALADLLIAWGVAGAAERKPALAASQLTGFAWAAQAFGIPRDMAATGFAWSWAENLVLAAVKTVPLGQTQGQCCLARLGEPIRAAVERGLALADADLGASAPALAIASARHETQYTRLFRS
jgi:urease accessory protein